MSFAPNYATIFKMSLECHVEIQSILQSLMFLRCHIHTLVYRRARHTTCQCDGSFLEQCWGRINYFICYYNYSKRKRVFRKRHAFCQYLASLALIFQIFRINAIVLNSFPLHSLTYIIILDISKQCHHGFTIFQEYYPFHTVISLNQLIFCSRESETI